MASTIGAPVIRRHRLLVDPSTILPCVLRASTQEAVSARPTSLPPFSGLNKGQRGKGEGEERRRQLLAICDDNFV